MLETLSFIFSYTFHDIKLKFIGNPFSFVGLCSLFNDSLLGVIFEVYFKYNSTYYGWSDNGSDTILKSEL